MESDPEPIQDCARRNRHGPPIPVGRYLGCEHRIPEKWVDWQGVAQTTLDPPAPKGQNADGVADAGHQSAAVAHGATQQGTMTLIYCDRSFHVPRGHSAWVRYDANANRYHTP
eukprot:9471372-Pyramimonas_sp.AAC.1